MDNQLSSPNTPAPAERPAGVNSENLAAPASSPVEAAAHSEPAGAPAQSAAAGASALSAADVAAALAATPSPAQPSVIQTPDVAGDVDVIEPAWVEKAEEVLLQHQGDPYGEEEAIELLQEDYLQKRYGIKVAEPNADDTKPKGT